MKCNLGGGLTEPLPSSITRCSIEATSGTTIVYLINGNNRRIGKKVNGTMVQGLLYQQA